MKQLTLFETSIHDDPLYHQINSLQTSQLKEIYVNGKSIRIELKEKGSNIPVFEYETDQEHGLAKGIDEIYEILKRIIDEEFNKQLI